MENNMNMNTGNEIYTCSMHPEVVSKEAGKCPKCGMILTKQKPTAEQEALINSGKTK